MRSVTNAIGFDKLGEKPFFCFHSSPIKEAFNNAVAIGTLTRGGHSPTETSLFEYLGDKITYQPGKIETTRTRFHIFRNVKDRTLKFSEAPKGYNPPKTQKNTSKNITDLPGVVIFS